MKRESITLFDGIGRLYWALHIYGRCNYSVNVFSSDGVNSRLCGVWKIKKI